LLSQAIRETEKNIDFYKKRVRRLSQYARKFKGVDKAVEIIEKAV
jgi:hypothetical protein